MAQIGPLFYQHHRKTLYLWHRNWPLFGKMSLNNILHLQKSLTYICEGNLERKQRKRNVSKASRENLGNSNANIFPQIVSHGAAK